MRKTAGLHFHENADSEIHEIFMKFFSEIDEISIKTNQDDNVYSIIYE